MSYDDEEQQRKSRVVVETPTARREVTQTETRRIPEDKSGFSTGMVALVAITAVAITALLFFFLTRDDAPANNNNLAVRTQPTQPTAIIQQAPPTTTTQPPTIIQQAPPTTTQAPPVIITQPAPGTTTSASPSAGGSTAGAPGTTDDLSLEDNVRRRITGDSTLASAEITVRVSNGRVRLEGSVGSQELKQRAEDLARRGGARSVENRITVTEGMEPSSTTSPPSE